MLAMDSLGEKGSMVGGGGRDCTTRGGMTLMK